MPMQSSPIRLAALAAVASVTFAAATAAHAQPGTFDTAAIERAAGMKGTMIQDEQVYKLSKPRSDLDVRIQGWKLPGFMGVGSWAAFTPMDGGQAMVMGDNALLEDEVGPAMRAALDNGLAVTALHNHFFHDEPKVYFMHVSGMGDPVALAKAIRQVFDAPGRSGTNGANGAARADTFGEGLPGTNAITGEPLSRILSHPGQANEGMYKVTIGRPVAMHGRTMGKEMGVSTWAGFAGTDASAVVDGDFAVHEDELQPVLKSLLADGLHVVAIHQHMTEEQPRMMFLHYWGRGPAERLAQAVRAALDRTATAREQRR